MEEKIIKLDQLKPGQKCKIVDLKIGGQTGQRLMDMGFFPGVEVEVVRNAPLVDPVELLINGYNMSLRHDVAFHVEVVLL